MFTGGDQRGRALAARAGAAIAALGALSLAACKPHPLTRVAVPASAAPAGASLFRVDAVASQLRFYLHADGPLARVGHSHVISAHAVEGSIWLQPLAEQSACELRLPVADFVVDAPQERAAAGNEFAEPLAAADREGTRVHMLGERQLDALRYPAIGLRCSRLTAIPGGMSVELAITLRDHLAQLTVPLQWQQQGDTLRASGEFSFRQSDLGLEPYSLMLGALRVADEIHARFVLVARRADAATRADATPRG
ncbi:MAG: YceI family protein [Gammaproteobacteria bacterium]|nr:YceI family protein [Gammaproteobacteria bacterium]